MCDQKKGHSGRRTANSKELTLEEELLYSETTECLFTTREFFSAGNAALGKAGDAKGKIKSALKYQIIQATLAKNNCPFSIRYLCILVGISRFEHYGWIKNSDNRTRKEVRDKENSRKKF